MTQEAEVVEGRFVAAHPYLLGELRHGGPADGTQEGFGVPESAMRGVRRMRNWFGKDLEWMDFALLASHRKPEELKPMAASGTWTDRFETTVLSWDQMGLVGLAALDRHQAMQMSLKRMGYHDWIVTAGRWRVRAIGMKDEDITEYGFLVPNARFVGKGSRREWQPFKRTVKFKRELLKLGNDFTQQAMIVRTKGNPVLYRTFRQWGTPVKKLESWNGDDLAGFLQAMVKVRPGGGSMSLLETCAFEKMKRPSGRLALAYAHATASVHGYWICDLTTT